MPRRARVALALFAPLFAAIAACLGDDPLPASGSSNPGPPTAPNVPQADAADAVDGSASDAGVRPPLRLCADGDPFCDDFERDEPAPRGWGSFFPNDVIVGFADDAGRNGTRGLVIEAAGTTGGIARVFLRKDHGDAPARFHYSLAFDAKVTVAPEKTLVGPRFMSVVPGIAPGDAGGGNRLDVVLSFNVQQVYMSAFAPPCSSDGGAIACGPLDELPKARLTHDGEWQRYLFELDVEPDLGTSKAKLSIQGQTQIELALPLPLSGKSQRATLFGVTHGDPTVVGRAAFDNVEIRVLDEDVQR